MRKILKLLKSEELWVVFLIVVSVGITVALFLNEVGQGKNLPPDRFQTFEHNFLPDFNAYLSKMTQGGKGEWLVYERMTNEAHEPSLLQIFYLVLGKIGIGIMGLRPDFAYHLSRFVLAVIRLGAAYYFICAVWPTGGRFVNRPYRILAFALFIFAGNFPFRIINSAEFGILIGEDKYRLVFETWTNLDPLVRLSYLPHWMAGQTAIMVGLGMLIRAHRDAPLQKYLLIGIIGMIGGFILPSVPLIIIPVWFVMTVINRKNIVGFVIGSILMAVPLVYIKWVTGFVPWSALAVSDAGAIMKFSWEGYIKALGVLGIGAIGMIWVIRERPRGLMVAALWVLVTMGMLFLFDTVFHYDQRRFVQVGVELPLSILTVYLFKNLKSYLLIIICGVLLIPSVFVWYISYMGRLDFVRGRVWATYPLVSVTPYVVYQPRDWMEGIFWLSKNTTVNDVVFTDYVAGNYIAAYAGNRVYLGHGGQTVNYLKKLTFVKEFYSGKMSEKDAKLFLSNNYAKYVFAGPQETAYGGTLKYSFLEPVYQGKTTRIYKIL